MFDLFPGAVINRWTLIRPLPPTTNYIVHWECRCECGKIGKPSAHNLKYGVTKGCGCRRGLRRKDEQIVGLRQLRTIYKGRAAKYGLSFNLPKALFETLVSQPCHYCGAEPREAMYGRVRIDKTRARVRYNGIDRFDSKRGYEPDNVVSCCWVCNRMKGAMDYTSFVAHIGNIWRKHGLPSL